MIEPVYKVIHIIEQYPDYSQRKIAKELGYSVGKVNYVIASLLEKGLLKLQRYLKASNKSGYRYILTPKGIKQKYTITKAFLRNKIREYDTLLSEIEEARQSLGTSEHREQY